MVKYVNTQLEATSKCAQTEALRCTKQRRPKGRLCVYVYFLMRLESDVDIFQRADGVAGGDVVLVVFCVGAVTSGPYVWS